MFGFSPAEGSGSITKQLCNYLRDHIEKGALYSGLKLPPTRKAAEELGIARNIVIEVYEQLTAEGYLTSITGSGTYIADGIEIRIQEADQPEQVLPGPGASIRMRDRSAMIHFDTAAPDLSRFPRRLWSKCVREVTESESADLFAYGDIQGLSELRDAISDYVYRMKGMCCYPNQIMITSGTSESFLLLAATFANSYQNVYIEEPTIDVVKHIFHRMKYNIHPVEVDHQGMDISRIEPSSPRGLIVVTPSHQYPTGSILSIQRRQQLIALANRDGHYLIEDDYNSEFRHKGSLIPPLQLLDPSRVIYAGTFSKTLSPALRIGFLVMPPSLTELVIHTKTDMNLMPSPITQSALARFMKAGYFDRHIHKMRSIYIRKRQYLVQICHRLFEEQVEVLGVEAGMHIQLAFRQDHYGTIDWSGLEDYGVSISAFDDYTVSEARFPNRVVLGYGNLSEEEIEEGLMRIRRFTEAWRHNKPARL